ncbi:hypothetical protein GF324_07495 [bacterium]|nr:hypothetical protein [bacterium]
MQFDRSTYRISDAGTGIRNWLLIAGVGLIASAAGAFVDPKQFFFSYLTAFAFWCTLALGGLIFVILHHLFGSTWSVVIRRMSETTMRTMPLFAVLVIPILIGIPWLYHWADPSYVAGDYALPKKAGYLNVPFFVIRTVFYFAVWVTLSILLYRASLKQDESYTRENAKYMRTLSAPAAILYAVTITLASFDWLMSLDAHWFSTIYGLWFFSGAVTAFFAYTTTNVVFLFRHNILKEDLTPEHFHDIGKLLFAFMIFWAYMALSQFLLIWYANFPKETVFYLARWSGSWRALTLSIPIIGFAVPFVILIMRITKRNLNLLAGMAWLLLGMHYVDLYWNIMPNLHTETVVVSWMDVATMLFIGALFRWYYLRLFTQHAVVPVNDPKLGASFSFVNQ